MHFYSFLCEEVLGQRPAAIRLMYLRTGETITATPSAQSVRFLTTRTTAVWKAVEKACLTGDFRPKQGALCNSCAFQPWCPAFGGDPTLAAVEAPLRFGRAGRRMNVLQSPAVESFDTWADAQLERLRGNRVADGCSPPPASSATSASSGTSSAPHAASPASAHAGQAFVFSALIGAESLIVNQGIKRLFRRIRPTEAGDPRYPVRKPSTSSFPSGHASAAFFAATRAHRLGRRQVTHPLWFALAGVVGTSRAYVRIHHPVRRRRRRRGRPGARPGSALAALAAIA